MAWKLLESKSKQHEVKASRLLIWNRFKKDEEGTAAIEFALLATPFLLICFAIFETGLSYFANRTLEASVNIMARDIRIGKITSSSYSNPGVVPAEAFKNELCALPTMALFDCAKLVVDVKSIDNFQEPGNPEYDANGNLKVENFDFAPGAGGTINVVSVYYDWPKFMDFTAFGIDPEDGKTHMMRSVTAFMNEAYN